MLSELHAQHDRPPLPLPIKPGAVASSHVFAAFVVTTL